MNKLYIYPSPFAIVHGQAKISSRNQKIKFVRIGSCISHLENFFQENAVYTCGIGQLCDTVELFNRFNYDLNMRTNGDHAITTTMYIMTNDVLSPIRWRLHSIGT